MNNIISNWWKDVKKNIKEKGVKNIIFSVIMIFLITCASLCLAFALYIIISAPSFEKDLLYKNKATIIYDVHGETIEIISCKGHYEE